MPPIRWHLLAVIVIFSAPWTKSTIAAELSDPLPVASNGWRPIIGNHEHKSYVTIETPRLTTQNNAKQTISLTENQENNNRKDEKNKNAGNQNGKGNGGNLVHVNHHGSTGHHSKLYPPPNSKPFKMTGPGNMHIIVTGKPAHRHPVMNKLHAHMALSAKRHKPRPLPTIRDEILAPAPSSAIGSYAFFNQGPLHLQNTLPGNKPFAPPSHHTDYSNHFGFPSGNDNLPLPQSHFHFAKHPSQNELHSSPYVFYNQNDEFTRNLVPPPQLYKPQGEKEVINENPNVVDQPSVNEQLIFGKQKDPVRHVPENVVVHLPGYSPFQQNEDNSAIDLEITKEKFMEFHTTLSPVKYQPTTESYLAESKPKEAYTKSTHHSYEVTEEKEYHDNIYHYKPIYSTSSPKLSGSSPSPYKIQFSTSIPQANKYQYSQVQPQAPEQQFLPTPYNTDNAFPTSPTQAEVSTIYSEVRTRKQNNYQTHDPTSYNIKDVATHFPIFEKKPDTQISVPGVSVRPREPEYINEVTTRRPSDYNDFNNFKEEVETTTEYIKPKELTTYPTRGTTWSGQRRPNQRRRRPTKPTTPTPSTEAYEPYRANSHNSYRTNVEQPNDSSHNSYRTNVEQPNDNSHNSYRIDQEQPNERPHRRRRPIKQRTTETPHTEPTSTVTSRRPTQTFRPRPTRLQHHTITEEVFMRKTRPKYKQHKYVEEEDTNQYIQDETETEYTTKQTRFESPNDKKKNERDENQAEHTTRYYSRFDRPEEKVVSEYFEDEYDPEHTTKYFSRFEKPTSDEGYRKEVYDEEKFENKKEPGHVIRNEQSIEYRETPTTESNEYNEYKYTDEIPPETTEQATRIKHKRKRIRPTTTTEILPTTNLKIPENELDYTTLPSHNDQSQETITIREVYNFETEKEQTTTLATTTTTKAPTTTTPTTTTKSNRIRLRPIKYDAQRPRFSVKDYRQRLTQYMSTSTEATKENSEPSRIRFPNRFRVTTAASDENDETNESFRQKFKPKDPRHRASSTEPSNEKSEESTTEKRIRPTNLRIRPFGRLRSTTESSPSASTTTTQKVSIKPNIFSSLKRPQHLSLRNRIYNKNKNVTSTTEANTEEPEVKTEEIIPSTEKTEVTIPFEEAESKIEVTTESYDYKREKTTVKAKQTTEGNTFKPTEVIDDTPNEDEAFLQLQRISDLTSSAHKQYNTPGLFKSVSPTVRRVPSYFTISTEEPFLPIEAFFPKINRKND